MIETGKPSMKEYGVMVFIVVSPVDPEKRIICFNQGAFASNLRKVSIGNTRRDVFFRID